MYPGGTHVEHLGICIKVHATSCAEKAESQQCLIHVLRHTQVALSVTSDTYINEHTFECARLAAGGSAQVAAMVARGEVAHGAAIVRPPGHHAESNVAMGFCFFNNAAVAAKAAQAAGAQRVLILDWDVHHGNGTQVGTR